MKHLIIAIAFVLVCLCIVSCLSDTIAPQLSVGRVTDLAHHVTKRQTTPTIQDLVDCSTAIVDYQCGSSGYAQQIVNIALECRNETYARNAANVCARSENGVVCGTAAGRFTFDQAQSFATEPCTGAISSGVCPSSCRSFLQSASSALGCCINTYINTTVSPGPLLELYGEYVNYRLWNLCNVPLPPADCGNGLPLNPPSQDARVCTLQELFARFADYECTPSTGQGLVDNLLKNSRCYIFARAFVDLCSVNPINNQFCAEALDSDVIGSGGSTSPLQTSLQSNCGSSGSFCSASCQRAITDAANTYGCCVNVYNNSNSGLQLSQLSYSLWNSCGVDTPGFCSASTLSSLAGQPPLTQNPRDYTLSGATTTKVFAWMIVLAVAIHTALYV